MLTPVNRDDQATRSPDMRPSTAWKDQAACRWWPLALFFPEPGVSVQPAKRICRGCPVRQACLRAGIEERHGIWGGLTRSERAALRRRKAGQTRADGAVTLEPAFCLGLCASSPALCIDERLHARVSPQRLVQLLDALELAP